MRFADPYACPQCRGAIAGQPACPHCGLDLTSLEARQLWQTLLQADALLAQAAQKRVAPASPAPAPIPAPPAGARRWSVGTILLVLGAFGLIVAGLIFVTRSWGDLGLAGRTLILLGVTAAIGALGTWVTRRPLRSSAEAVWTVFLSLLTLDFFAARHEDLAGLSDLGLGWSWILWGVVLLALGVGIAAWARRHVGSDLVAPAVAGGVGLASAGIGAALVAEDWSFAWRTAVALVVVGLLALATRPAGVRPMTVVARVVVAGFFLAAFVGAAVELVDHPNLGEMIRDGHGVPMLLMAVASVVVAALVRPARVAGVALATIAATSLFVTPAAHALDPEGGWVAAAGAAAVLAVVAARGAGDWWRGLRAGALPVVGGVVLLHLVLLGEVLETAGWALDHPWDAGWTTRLDAPAAANHEEWVVPLVLAGLVAIGWFVPRWPELAPVRKHASSVLAAVAGLGVVDAVVAARLPVWAGAALVLLAAGGLAAGALVAGRRAGPVGVHGPVSAVLVVVAAALASASHGVSVVAWAGGAVLLALLASGRDPLPLRRAHAAGAVALGTGSVAAGVELLDVDREVTILAVLVAALAIITGAGLLLPSHPVRRVVEAAAGLAGLVALLVPGDTTHVAVRWTVVGVVLVALCFVVRGRRWYLWTGIGALVVAYLLLVVDNGFTVVEAFTLPLGAVALAAGLYFARRRPEASTWLLLGPGLALALLPSVPQALVDPTDVRALLLGLGSVVVLVIGIRLGWQAPFVSGAVVLGLLVLFNIGPYANAAPRVVLIATVSAILLGVGITWEDRVRDGRRLVAYVRAMR